MALPYVKSAAPKIIGTLGLSSVRISSCCLLLWNKKINKDHIIKISDKQLNDINKNLEKINNMNVFDKKNYFESKRIWYIFIFTSNVSINYYTCSYT